MSIDVRPSSASSRFSGVLIKTTPRDVPAGSSEQVTSVTYEILPDHVCPGVNTAPVPPDRENFRVACDAANQLTAILSQVTTGEKSWSMPVPGKLLQLLQQINQRSGYDKTSVAQLVTDAFTHGSYTIGSTRQTLKSDRPGQSHADYDVPFITINRVQ